MLVLLPMSVVLYRSPLGYSVYRLSRSKLRVYLHSDPAREFILGLI